MRRQLHLLMKQIKKVKKKRERKILEADIMGNTTEHDGLNIAGSV